MQQKEGDLIFGFGVEVVVSQMHDQEKLLLFTFFTLKHQIRSVWRARSV